MLSITWSRLGLRSSLMLFYVVFTSSSSPPPPPISSEQVHYSSSFKSLTDDPKVIMDFFLGGEVIGLNVSLGVGGSIRVFSQWD